MPVPGGTVLFVVPLAAGRLGVVAVAVSLRQLGAKIPVAVVKPFPEIRLAYFLIVVAAPAVVRSP